MWWKFYFWGYLFINLIGIVTFYGNKGPLTLGDWLSFILTILGGMALYSYVFGRKILNQIFWKLLFWIIVAHIIFIIVWSSTPLKDIFPFPEFLNTTLPETKYFISALFGFAIGLPTYFAIYKLGQGIKLKTKR